MDQDYFYVELPSGTVVSYTTQKAAESAARDYGGKILKGKAADNAEVGTAERPVVEGAHIVGDATGSVENPASPQSVGSTGEATVPGAEHGQVTGNTGRSAGKTRGD